MANMELSASQILDVGAAVLLDKVEKRFAAYDPIEDGRSGTKVSTVDDTPGGTRPIGLTQYRQGFHRPEDLDIRATYANQRALADANSGIRKPQAVNVIVEHGYRYKGSVGEYGLRSLARATLAVTGAVATQNGLNVYPTFVGDRHAPVSFGPSDGLDQVDVIGQYDKFADKADKSGPKRSKDSAEALITGLRRAEDNLASSSDVAIVISDLIMGAERDEDGNLIGFNWESHLHDLMERMGDRLYVVRLTHPGQQNLPPARNIEVEGETLNLDSGDYVNQHNAYNAQAILKAEKIAKILSGARLLRLDSTDTKPLSSLTGFLTGRS